MQGSTAGRASLVQYIPRQAPPLQLSAPPCNQHRRFRKRSWSCLQIDAKAASAETEEAPKVTRTRGRPAKNGSTAAPKQARSQEPPPLPLPQSYQQTLKQSFLLGGVGLHTGEYATVRVMPAMAGEGRYFVRVPQGHISPLFVMNEPQEVDFSTEDGEEDIEEDDAQMNLFQEYLLAQEEANDGGQPFHEWAQDHYEAPVRDIINAAVAEMTKQQPAKPREEGEDFVQADLEHVSQDKEANFTTVGHGDNRLSILKCIAGKRHSATIGRGGGRVHSVEALLSALEQSGVDNARIEIEGGHEIPVVDGSAMGWVIETQKAGLVPAPIKDKASSKLDRLLEAPASVVMVREGDAFVTFYPEKAQRVTCGIDHIGEAMIIGKQWMSWAPAEDEPYRWSLSPARNYYTHPQQVIALFNEGYLKGGTDDASVIGFGDRWYRPKDVRFYDDEPIRHRLCDLLGDLALLAKNGNAGMPRGHVVAYKANHALHIRFLRELSKTMS